MKIFIVLYQNKIIGGYNVKNLVYLVLGIMFLITLIICILFPIKYMGGIILTLIVGVSMNIVLLQ